MWHVSYVAFIVFSSPVDGLPLPFLPPLTPPPPLDAPWQKASTRPPIHGALLGRWFSLVILPCWATPPISASMVPSLPLTPKTDWWALPSHFRFVFLWRHNEVFDTFWLMHHWGLLSDCAFKSLGVFAFFFLKKRQPLPLSPQNYPLHGSEVNGAHPAGFHSGSSSFGVPSHTPPIASTDTIMGKPFCCVLFVLMQYHHTEELLLNNDLIKMYFSCQKANRGAVPGSSGDEIGKALASVSSNKHMTLHVMLYIVISYIKDNVEFN